MKCSCLDIGSNTIKVSVFEKRGKHWNTVAYLGEQTRLINYVFTDESIRILSQEGIDALLSALERLIAFSEEKGANHLFAFATASLRGIDNIEEVMSAVLSHCGITLEVLSGEEEAICSLKGLLTDERCENLREGVMIDMGGGSTEVVYFRNGKDPVIVSLPFGCLSLTSACVESFPPSLSEVKKVCESVRGELDKCSFVKNLNCEVFLIGGTARAAAKLIMSLTLRKKEEFKARDFKSVFEKMVDDESVRTLAGNLIPKRVHTITAGCAAYFELLSFISPKSVFVSESGVREGYLERILM